jgi:CRISPR-associated protein Cas5d
LTHPPLEVKVWGDFACWTRPEMKAERVSYPVMTPSGARGICEAIFWKPEFGWQVRAIKVLKPIRHFSIVRNEVNNKAVAATAAKWQKEGGGYFAEEDRAQRHTLALRDVAYIIQADVVLKPHATEDVAKYRDQFRRRVADGKCYHIPYLGCREFAANFGPPEATDAPIDLSDDLGRMLFDQVFQPRQNGPLRWKSHDAQGERLVHGMVHPQFFAARLDKGVLSIDPALYREEG